MKWSHKIGQSVKVYSNEKKEYQNDETTEVFGSIQASESDFRKECAQIIQKDFNALSAAEKEAVNAEFEAGLSARVFVQDFKKASWESRGVFLDALKFWSERGTALPSSDEFSKGNSQGTIDEMREKVKNLEEELKKKY